VLLTVKSGIFYYMETARSNSHGFKLALAAVALVALAALAAIACNDDDSSPANGSPSPDASPDASPNASPDASPDASPSATTTGAITPVSGPLPIHAIINYLQNNGLDEHKLDLDLTEQTVCPSSAQLETPEATSTLTLGQFCLIFIGADPEMVITIVELPDTDTAWEMNLEPDADASQWKVTDVDKIRG
jgi:hypothetical protein